VSKRVARTLASFCSVFLFSFFLAIPVASAHRSEPLPSFTRRGSHQQVHTSEVHTGLWHGRVVNYTIENGRAISEGDIILGQVDPFPTPRDPQLGGRCLCQLSLAKVDGVATSITRSTPAAATDQHWRASPVQFRFPGLIQW